MLLQMSLIMLAEKRETLPPILSAIPHSVRILVELLSLLARQQTWHYHLQQAQSLILVPYTGTLVVYSSLYLLSTVLLYTTNQLLYSSLYLLSTTVVFI